MSKDADIIEGSFVVEQRTEIAAPRAKAWAALLDVDAWWSHHMFKPRRKFVLEPWPGGRFYEAVENNQGALWGTVTHLETERLLRLSGALGMSLPVSSCYEYRLTDGPGQSTVLHLTHRAIGILMKDWKQRHEDGWAEMMKNLTAFTERGARVAPASTSH